MCACAHKKKPQKSTYFRFRYGVLNLGKTHAFMRRSIALSTSGVACPSTRPDYISPNVYFDQHAIHSTWHAFEVGFFIQNELASAASIYRCLPTKTLIFTWKIWSNYLSMLPQKSPFPSTLQIKKKRLTFDLFCRICKLSTWLVAKRWAPDVGQRGRKQSLKIGNSMYGD